MRQPRLLENRAHREPVRARLAGNMRMLVPKTECVGVREQITGVHRGCQIIGRLVVKKLVRAKPGGRQEQAVSVRPCDFVALDSIQGRPLPFAIYYCPLNHKDVSPTS